MYFSPLNINRPVVYLSGGDVKNPFNARPGYYSGRRSYDRPQLLNGLS